MKIPDNTNFFILEAFSAEIVIHISKKITKRIKSWLSPAGQALIKVISCYVKSFVGKNNYQLQDCLAANNFKTCRLFHIYSSWTI